MSHRPSIRPHLGDIGEHTVHVRAQQLGSCPCLHTTPCDPDCTCVRFDSSRGCDRCCSYGSPDQQRAAAERIASALRWTDRDLRVEDVWTEGKRQVGAHHICCVGSDISIFGNDRDFPAPPPGSRLTDAFVGLVGQPHRMALPQGRVDVVLPSGDLLAIGDAVPVGVSRLSVKTPLASGCSNWAGPCLLFERAP